jgi:hypothetical protein
MSPQVWPDPFAFLVVTTIIAILLNCYLSWIIGGKYTPLPAPSWFQQCMELDRASHYYWGDIKAGSNFAPAQGKMCRFLALL